MDTSTEGRASGAATRGHASAPRGVEVAPVSAPPARWCDPYRLEIALIVLSVVLTILAWSPLVQALTLGTRL